MKRWWLVNPYLRSRHYFQFGNLLQALADVVQIGSIVDRELYFGTEDAVVCLNVHTMDVHLKFLGKDTRNAMQDAQAVDTFNVYRGREEQLLVRIPVGRQNMVSVACFLFIGNGALAFVDGNERLTIKIAQDIIARNGMTARTKGVASDGFLVE